MYEMTNARPHDATRRLPGIPAGAVAGLGLTDKELLAGQPEDSAGPLPYCEAHSSGLFVPPAVA